MNITSIGLKEGDKIISPIINRKGIVTEIDVRYEMFRVKWDGHDRCCEYPINLIGEEILIVGSTFKDEDNPNLTFKKGRRSELK